MLNMQVLQPFWPWLMCKGEIKGPSILMDKLRGNIDSEEAMKRCDALEDDTDEEGKTKTKQSNLDPMHKKYACLQCFLHARDQASRPTDTVDPEQYLWSPHMFDCASEGAIHDVV